MSLPISTSQREVPFFAIGIIASDTDPPPVITPKYWLPPITLDFDAFETQNKFASTHKTKKISLLDPLRTISHNNLQS